MSEKILKSRIAHKHDIESNWLKATNFTPMSGEIIIYDIDENYNYERMKIGDGTRNVNDLPFIDENINASKVDKVDGKGLSTNDYTNEDKEKLINASDSVDTLTTLVGDTSVSEQISEALLNSQVDWDQTDSTKPDYIKNKPDENDALELVSEMGLVEPVFAEDGSIYTDKNGVIYTL